MEYNYTAIVLRKKKIGETDRLYTFYTLESGKIQAIGRGIRKPRAKLAGHVETLNQSDVIVARRHGLGNIASVIAERYFLHLKSDEAVLKRVLEAVSYFERLVDFEEKDDELFVLLQEYLSTVDALVGEGKIGKTRSVTQGFLFRLLSHLGYHLEMRYCAFSGNPLVADGRYFFSPDIGGVIGSEYVREAKRAFEIDKNAIKLIRIFFHNRLSSLSRLHADDLDLVQVEKVSSSFIAWISR